MVRYIRKTKIKRAPRAVKLFKASKSSNNKLGMPKTVLGQDRSIYLDRLDAYYKSFWVGRFFNMFIRKGKKQTVENALQKVIIHLKRSFGKKVTFPMLFFYLLNRSRPWFEIKKYAKRGELKDFPKLLRRERGYSIATRKIALLTKETKAKLFWQKVYFGIKELFLHRKKSSLEQWRQDLLKSVLKVRYLLRSGAYSRASRIRYKKSSKTRYLKRFRISRSLFFMQYFKQRMLDKPYWPKQVQPQTIQPQIKESFNFKPSIVQAKRWVISPWSGKKLKRRNKFTATEVAFYRKRGSKYWLKDKHLWYPVLDRRTKKPYLTWQMHKWELKKLDDKLRRLKHDKSPKEPALREHVNFLKKHYEHKNIL